MEFESSILSFATKTEGFNMKKAKYLVSGFFGLIPKGTVIDCYVLNEDVDKALVYHPAKTIYSYDGELVSEDGCGCFEICKLNQNEQWESIHEESYCNFGKMPKEFKKYLKENL